MAMSLDEQIRSLFPGARANIDYWLVDQGEGPFIWQWNLDVPKPTPEQLAAAKPLFPNVISDRQFFQAMALMGLITKDEALAAVSTGTVPQEMAVFLDHITDPTERFGAEMLLSGATQFERDHPLVEAFGQSKGLSSEQIDDIWRLAASL